MVSIGDVVKLKGRANGKIVECSESGEYTLLLLDRKTECSLFGMGRRAVFSILREDEIVFI
jgi:hypothetical protein